MSRLLSYIPVVSRLLPAAAPATISLEPVEVHSIETAPEKRPRTLKHLLRANHVNHSILYHDLSFDNHMVHHLGSAYLLGADAAQLNHIYDVEAKSLEPWRESPAEVVREDWREFLGAKEYQRAYVDFFEDQLAMRFSYDWKQLVEEYMFHGENPLVNGLIGGLGHPLIHLGYAFEIDNREVAIEALALTAVQYNYLHKYIDDRSYTKPALFKLSSPTELLNKLAKDKRFDGLFPSPGYSNIDKVFQKHEDLLLEYWNAWDITNPTKQFEESQEAAVNLLVATVPPGRHSYNFFIVHLLTTSHAARILLPYIPAKFHINVVREWWLLTLAVYIAFGRPKIDPDYIPTVPKEKGWGYLEEKAVAGRWNTDAHYVKAIRALKEMERTWGDVHDRYLAAAVRFADDFEGWVFS